MGDRRTAELIRRAGAVALGVLIGLAALEAMVRPFVSPTLPPHPDIARDELAGPLIETRQLDEGVATSHFTSGGSRWTGSAPAPDAPAVVIIGDSYVVAREVSDDETMGAWVERFAREEGRALTVRQYGWVGARPAQYIHVAPAVIQRWSPSAVVVILADNDFDTRALTDTFEAPPPRTGLPARFGLAVLARHRTIVLEQRAQRTIERWRRRLDVIPSPNVIPSEARDLHLPPVNDAEPDGPSPPPPAASNIESDVVSRLKRAYGSRLKIVYVANTFFPDDTDLIGQRLAVASLAEGVPFVSTRASMRALERLGIITRGFPTTKLGSGHLNPHGHEMMGRLIWPMVRPR